MFFQYYVASKVSLKKSMIFKGPFTTLIPFIIRGGEGAWAFLDTFLGV